MVISSAKEAVPQKNGSTNCRTGGQPFTNQEWLIIKQTNIIKSFHRGLGNLAKVGLG